MPRRTFIAAALASWVAWVPPAHPCGMMIARNDTLRFNDALQFAVVREGTKTTMTLQNKYRGPSEQFALLVPVPVVLREGDVKTLDLGVFEELERMTAPTLSRLDERDPCESDDGDGAMAAAPGGAPGSGAANRGAGVTVESQFVVGEYEVAVLSATEATAVDKWLTDHGYVLPPALASQLRPYVEAGSKFFVAKVDPAKVKLVDGAAFLSPLQFTYDAPELRLPIRLSAANSPGVQDVIVYAFARDQKQLRAANRPNLAMPANVEITKEAAAEFPAFYAALFAKRLGDKRDAVVTEWANRTWPTPQMQALGAAYQADGWTLARLHFAVDKHGTQDDLLLAEGPMTPTYTSFTHKVRWTGRVACDEPRYDRYRYHPSTGGDLQARRDTRPSTTPLSRLVAADVPDLGILSEAKPAPRISDDDARPRKRSSGGGCCDSGGSATGALTGLALAVLLRKRRGR
ncbi:MAG: DUF2330 domain-containing protein [Deltaproteobacteria bacterium]|nr:DUF2330 domain-containing protein [Deltaproteobacteria bacterium]